MADCRVTHIRKLDRFSKHEHITHIGNLAPQWILTREDAIRRIETNTDTFFVLDGVTGKRSEVGVVHPNDGRSPFLRTHADGFWNDNLLSLPEF